MPRSKTDQQTGQRKAVLTTRVSPAELDEITRLATAAGYLYVAEYVRDRCLTQPVRQPDDE
jgi:hypothetical protein